MVEKLWSQKTQERRKMQQKHENQMVNRLKELFGRSIILEMTQTGTHQAVIHAIAKSIAGDITLFTIKFGSKIKKELILEAREGAEKSSWAQVSTPSIASITDLPAGCYYDGIAVGMAGFSEKTTNQIFATTFASTTALLINADRKQKEKEERNRKEKEKSEANAPPPKG